MFELVVSQRQHEFKLRLPVVALGDVEQLALAHAGGRIMYGELSGTGCGFKLALKPRMHLHASSVETVIPFLCSTAPVLDATSFHIDSKIS